MFTAIPITLATLSTILVINRHQPARLVPERKATFDAWLAAGMPEQATEARSPLQTASKCRSVEEVLDLIDSAQLDSPRRQESCGFVEQLLQTKDFEAQKEFHSLFVVEGITRCIPADVPETQRAAWIEAVSRALWNTSWIPHRDKLVSLQTLARETWKQPLPSVDFAIYESQWPDGGYAHQNAQDARFVEQHPSLSRATDADENWIPGTPWTKSTLPQLKAYAEEQPLRFVDVFVSSSRIYPSPHWAPQDLVSVLVHEMGHILFDSRHLHFSLQDGNILYDKDTLQDESVAEFSEWMVVRQIAKHFPAVGFLQKTKLSSFSCHRPMDPHYVGLGSIFDRVRAGENPSEILDRLLGVGALEDVGSGFERQGSANRVEIVLAQAR